MKKLGGQILYRSVEPAKKRRQNYCFCTTIIEQNAMSAWIYFTGRAEIGFSLLAEMYYFIHRQLREDQLVGSVIHFIDSKFIEEYF